MPPRATFEQDEGPSARITDSVTGFRLSDDIVHLAHHLIEIDAFATLQGSKPVSLSKDVCSLIVEILAESAQHHPSPVSVQGLSDLVERVAHLQRKPD
jgi:hypothetical protein